MKYDYGLVDWADDMGLPTCVCFERYLGAHALSTASATVDGNNCYEIEMQLYTHLVLGTRSNPRI